MSAAAQETPSIQAGATESGGTVQLVSFCLANEEYGIAITKVRAIILMGAIVNLRSTVIPVVDLRIRFGLVRLDKRLLILLDLDRLLANQGRLAAFRRRWNRSDMNKMPLTSLHTQVNPPRRLR